MRKVYFLRRRRRKKFLNFLKKKILKSENVCFPNKFLGFRTREKIPLVQRVIGKHLTFKIISIRKKKSDLKESLIYEYVLQERNERIISCPEDDLISLNYSEDLS